MEYSFNGVKMSEDVGLSHYDEMRQFVNRCKSELKESLDNTAQELQKTYLSKQKIINKRWRTKNPESFRESKKKYGSTDKGKYALTKRDFNRRTNYKEACEGLTFDEKILIGRFYKNCPKGYEVDHIIPVSRGGKHTLSNLQYLTREENRRKHAKTWDEYQKTIRV